MKKNTTTVTFTYPYENEDDKADVLLHIHGRDAVRVLGTVLGLIRNTIKYGTPSDQESALLDTIRDSIWDEIQSFNGLEDLMSDYIGASGSFDLGKKG